ncbi:MAG: hypothetical protein QM589_16420 [Thermomicrobiales bacterium]
MAESSTARPSYAAYLDQLIGTYRELNLRVRPLPESTLSAARGGTSVHRIVQAMRDRELAFAQALKERTTAYSPEEGADGRPITGLETDEDSTAMLISQFGTARGTTLSTLKALPAEAWQAPGSDGTSLEQAVQSLIAQDKGAVDQILSLLTA